eukprot:1378954-Prorocentrum_lima.AAC.1
MTSSLVGSEMCIRDRVLSLGQGTILHHRSIRMVTTRIVRVLENDCFPQLRRLVEVVWGCAIVPMVDPWGGTC